MANAKSSVRPDYATLIGFLLAVGGIAAGLVMDGGQIQDVAQLTSALIVLGGTIGAVMVTTPLPLFIRAARKLPLVFLATSEDSEAEAVDQIIQYATAARKSGIVSLDMEVSEIQDPFLKKALSLAVDGIKPSQIRDIMELELQIFEDHYEAEAGVFEAAGGYAPTIGIIGAVLGLTQVMKHLANVDEVGKGIAISFVATIYGVALANLLCLPFATKLRTRGKRAVQLRELILEGVISIAEGVNQKLIRMKLEAYLGPAPEPAAVPKLEAAPKKDRRVVVPTAVQD